MKVDATTPVDELVNACSVPSILTHVGRKNRDAALAELTRRSELAAKYERLTQALAGLVTPSRDVLLLSDGVQVGVCEDFDYERDPVSHDGTPDGIAAAIIAAAEGA